MSNNNNSNYNSNPNPIIKKPRLDIEDLTYQIRQHRINGFTKHQIMKSLNISHDTYEKYMKIIFQQDADTLTRKREQALATDMELYKNRLEKALVNLNALYHDNTATVKEKTEVIKAIVDVANKLLRVDSEGTALLELKPELRELIESAGAFVRNKIEINQYNFGDKKGEENKVIKMEKEDELFG